MDKLLLHFKVGEIERTVAKGMLNLFAKDATDEDIISALSAIQTQIIPYILYGTVNERSP